MVGVVALGATTALETDVGVVAGVANPLAAALPPTPAPLTPPPPDAAAVVAKSCAERLPKLPARVGAGGTAETEVAGDKKGDGEAREDAPKLMVPTVTCCCCCCQAMRAAAADVVVVAVDETAVALRGVVLGLVAPLFPCCCC